MGHNPLTTCLALSSCSAFGVLAPELLPTLKPYFSVLRPFSTGVILSIALVHLLPDALKQAEGIKMPAWAGEFPLANGLVILGFLLMVGIEQIFACPSSDAFLHSSSCATSPSTFANEKSALLPTQAHPHPPSSSPPCEENVYKLYMLEISIAVHSVFIGEPWRAKRNSHNSYCQINMLAPP